MRSRRSVCRATRRRVAEVMLYRTDADGRVTLPVQAGHAYLADAVILRPLDPEAEKDPVWESIWASLTFARAPE